MYVSEPPSPRRYRRFAFNLGFLEPYGALTIGLAEQIVDLAVFVAVALTAGTLVAREADQGVVAAEAVQGVVAFATVDRIDTVGALEFIWSRRTDDSVEHRVDFGTLEHSPVVEND